MIPPFGTNPPSRPIVEYDTDLSDRATHSDPRELWYLALSSKLNPNQTSLILRSALGGDLWQQFQLYLLMLDTWPMFRKCDHEIREAVSSVKFVARPYCEDGKEPTASAKEKADFVNRNFKTMRPNRFNDERSFKGMVYHMSGGFSMGLMMEELIYNQPKYTGNGQFEQTLRAAAFVHPRAFTFANSGEIAIFDDNYNRLYFKLGEGRQSPDPKKFVCGQFLSSSGSTLGAGYMRPLAWSWSSVVYNREWMARAAENFGAPFVDVTYRPGMSPAELSTLDRNIKAGLANRFIRHLEGTTLNVVPASSLGSDNPQRALMEMADRQCQMLMLGQTSSTGIDGGGNYGQSQAHMTVRGDRIEGVAKWVAAEPLTQVAQSILMVNYGDNVEEIPTIEPEFDKPMSAMEQAQFLAILGSCPVPMAAEKIYHRMGFAVPEKGDKILCRGQLGVLGDTDQVIDPSPEPDGPEGSKPKQAAGNDKAKAASQPFATGGSISARISSMSPHEVLELNELVTAAEHAPRLNGDWDKILERLK